MTQKIVCALFVLVAVFTVLNYAAAEEKAVVVADAKTIVVAAADGCPCGAAPVAYRRGLFGHYHPAAIAPVVVPAPIPAAVAVPPCSGPVNYRLGWFGRYYHPVYPRPMYPKYITF